MDRWAAVWSRSTANQGAVAWGWIRFSPIRARVGYNPGSTKRVKELESLKEDWTNGAGWRRWAVWLGRAVSVWPVYVLVSSATWKLTRTPWYVAEWERIGYDETLLTAIGIVQVACLVLYVVPQTSVLGAVLLTGYLGGAISSYVRMGEPSPVLVPLSTSLAAWAGIYLREQRLWRLLPLRWSRRRDS